MRDSITISIPKSIRKALDKRSRKEGKSRSAVVSEVLTRFFAVERFRALNDEMVAEAQKKGIYTEEDVYKRLS